jgi:predicted transcriptional regulator
MRKTISQHEVIRRRRGFTQTALAARANVSPAYVSLVEGGLEKPSPRSSSSRQPTERRARWNSS